MAAYLPFHILLSQNTRPGRRTDVRSCYSGEVSAGDKFCVAGRRKRWKGPFRQKEGPVRGQTLQRAKTITSEKQRPTPERKLGRHKCDNVDLRKHIQLWDLELKNTAQGGALFVQVGGSITKVSKKNSNFA